MEEVSGRPFCALSAARSSRKSSMLCSFPSSRIRTDFGLPPADSSEALGPAESREECPSELGFFAARYFPFISHALLSKITSLVPQSPEPDLFVSIHCSAASVLAEASKQFGGEIERVKAFNATKLCRCLLMYDV